MEKLTRFSVDNRTFIVILALFLSIGSLFVLKDMSKRDTPAIILPGTAIVVTCPGSSPEDLEKLVVRPMEEAFGSLSDVDSIKSTAAQNVAVVNITFKFGTDADRKYEDVMQRLDGVRASLPSGVASVDNYRFDISNLKVYEIALVAPEASHAEMEAELGRLKDRLSRIEGLQSVETSGAPERQVLVSLDLERLAAMGIPLGLVAKSIQSGNSGIPAGAVDVGPKRLGLAVDDSFSSVEDIKAVSIPMKGRYVRLGDIAKVELGEADQGLMVRVDGKKALLLTAAQKRGSNIFAIDRGVKAALADCGKALPAGMELRVVFDQSLSVRASVGGFFRNLVESILLVGLVILAGLGGRMSLVVMLNVPIVCLVTIGFLGLSGHEIEQMSISGLIIALGMLVDDAIVGTENISRHQRLGHPIREATILGIRQIRIDVVVGTLTTVIAFVPMVLLGSEAGEFIKSMPMAVIAALLLSLLLSLSFVPAVASRILVRAKVRDDRLLLRGLRRLAERVYRPVLAAALRHPGRTLGLALALFAAGIAALGMVGSSMFPMAEVDRFFVDIRTPPGSSLGATDEAALAVERALLAHPEVLMTTTSVGKGNPRIILNMPQENQRADYAQILVELVPAKPAAHRAFAQALRKEFASWAGLKLEVREIRLGSINEAPIALRILGEDSEVLAALAERAEEAFRSTPGVVNVQNSASADSTQLRVSVDRARAASLGVAVSDVSSTLRAAFAGSVVTSYRDPSGEEFDVVLRMERGSSGKASLEDLSRVYVPSASGAMLPLSELATLAWSRSPQRVSHYNSEREALVTADAAAGRNVNEVTDAIMARLAEEPLPDGYRHVVAGEKESSREAFAGLGALFLGALLAMFGLLVWQYGNLSQPLVILSAIPLSFTGAGLGLLVSGNTLSFTALLGLASLAGIVVKNSVILIDFINDRRRHGHDLDRAIAEAGEVRMMPIFLTAGTSILGLLPLILSGSKLWGPMAWVQACGLLVATCLTLVVVPVLYRLFCRRLPERYTGTDEGADTHPRG